MRRQSIFLLAPDSFKGTLSASQVCDAMERGIKRVFSNAICLKVPMADGGEGTVEALLGPEGELITKQVTGPLGRPVQASYGVIEDGTTALIEMASASGLSLLSPEERNPLKATTYGTGELILDALDRGVKRILIGLGGSATNDAGAGCMQALGVHFFDANGKSLPLGGAALQDLHTIDDSELDGRLKEVEILLACDVENPLIGAFGAANVFGPQKGATPGMVKTLERAMNHFATQVKLQIGKDIAYTPGAGAAGGLGGGLFAFTSAELHRGVDLVIEHTRLRDKIRVCDYVFTGEGTIDNQTRFGKTPYGVAKLAKKMNRPVIGVAGSIGAVDALYNCGFNALFSIVPGILPQEKVYERTSEYITTTVENIVRVMFCDTDSIYFK